MDAGGSGGAGESRALRLWNGLARGRTVLILGAINSVFAFGLFPIARGWVVGRECAVRCERLPELFELQLCFSAATFWSIVEAWTRANPEAVSSFIRGLALFDFLFPLAYAGFLSGLYRWVAARIGVAPRPWLVRVPWLAAGLDVVENVITIVVLLLGRPPELAGASALAVTVMSLAAALKWSLLLLALLLTAATALLPPSPLGPALLTCRYGFLSVALGSIPILIVPQGQDILRGLVDSEPGLVRAASFLFLVAWAASAWYWSRVLLMIRLGPLAPPGLREWMPRVLGAAACFGFGLACLTAARVPQGWSQALLVDAGASAVLGGVFLAGVTKRRQVLKMLSEKLKLEMTHHAATDVFEWRELPRGTKAASVVAGILSLVLPLFFTFSLFAASLGTLSVVFLAAANAVFLGSLTVFLGRLWRLPLVTLALLLAAAFSRWNDNHAVRLAGAPAERPALSAAFRHWIEARQRERAPETPIPVILVASEGGGLRAAYWSATALGRIQDRAPGFARHVFAISGVSGGSLGGAVFASLVARDLDRGGATGSLGPCEGSAPPGAGRFEACAAAALSSNFLAPPIAKMLGPDFLQWFLPVPVPAFDRGRALEDAWAAAYARATGDDQLFRPFLDLWARHPTESPALLINVAHVESGRRLVESPFLWNDGAVFPDTYDLLAAVDADLPLKTAVHNSARFAYVSPAGRLLARSGRALGHVVDGGYFENSGAVTVLDLRRALEEQEASLRQAGVLRSPLRYHALYLCNDPLRCGREAVGPAEIEAAPPAKLSDLLAPVRALLAAREARGSLALADLSDELHPEFTQIGVCPLLAQEETMSPLPLGWQLSAGVRQRMAEQLRGCEADPKCPTPCLGTLDNASAIERLKALVGELRPLEADRGGLAAPR